MKEIAAMSESSDTYIFKTLVKTVGYVLEQ